MGKTIEQLLENNRNWSKEMTAKDPQFFSRLQAQQKPEYLYIGCADSRVPANQIIGLQPGEVFVHRNIANVVVHSDFNCLSVLEYAVSVLEVKHIIVCGHYNCGGVKAATQRHKVGLIDNWLRHIRDVRQKHDADLAKIEDDQQRFDRMCELNVLQQMQNVCHTTIVQNAWDKGKSLNVHAWIYSLRDGLIKDLKSDIGAANQISSLYRVDQPLLA